MAVNKNALLRFNVLDKCFRNTGRRYSFEDLLEECNNALLDANPESTGIKRRQLFDDISFMESEKGWSIPLEREKEGKKVYYRYEDSKFSISNQPLNEIEANQLKEALLILSRFKGMPQFEWVDELVVRLESAFKLKGIDSKIIDFEQNPFLKGLEHFSELFNAIIYKRPIQITYKGFKQSVKINYLIHPYFLKQYNNRWFLFGLNDERNEITNIALDRIQSVKVISIEFKENEIIDFNDYFEDMVGVTSSKESIPEKILIKVNNEYWPYIETKPIHGSQKIKNKDKEFVLIELNVIVNYEFISLLFSHGENITIIEPKGLSEEIVNRAKKLIKNY